jgi:energy-coupling factor transport system permease protein
VDNLELMRHVTIGQYLPTDSWLHRLDPRIKIVGLGLLIITVVAVPGVGRLLLGLGLITGLLASAQVPLGFAFGGLRPALPFLLLIAAFQLFFGWGVAENAGCQALWNVSIIDVSTCSVLVVLAMLLRVVSLFLLTGLLTMTSTISELTHGIEKMLRPLQHVGFPAHELSMVLTIAIRFVPTLVEELEKLLKAQMARGADIRLGANPIQRTRQFLPILVPLFLTTLRRGDMLVEAMEARGYVPGAKRTHYVQLGITTLDIVALIAGVTIAAGIIYAPLGLLDAWLVRQLVSIAGN